MYLINPPHHWPHHRNVETQTSSVQMDPYQEEPEGVSGWRLMRAGLEANSEKIEGKCEATLQPERKTLKQHTLFGAPHAESKM